MGKIDEFEQTIIKQGMTDKDFIEYEKMLKRVRGDFLKRQHCYTTAIQFPPEYADQAIKLIQYGLEKFEDDWFSTYTSYLYIGRIYEKISDYKNAFDAYLAAKNALGTDHPDYVNELSRYLFWTKLHIDSFRYSPELEEYYLCYTTTDDFSKSFINNEFKLCVANIVISLYHGNTADAKNALEKAKEICRPNYFGKLHNILARHKCEETFNTTPEAMAFIKSVKL